MHAVWYSEFLKRHRLLPLIVTVTMMGLSVNDYYIHYYEVPAKDRPCSDDGFSKALQTYYAF